MFFNYLKSAWRNIYKRKKFSLLNILGLSIGMASCLLILQYVNYEKSYDNFHPDLSRLYRVNLGIKNTSDPAFGFLATNHPAAGPALKRDFQEVEDVARLVDASVLYGASIMSYHEDGKEPRIFYEDDLYLADPAILTMFGYPLIEGNPHTALASQANVVITESMAKKYFGDEAPMGKTLSLNGQLEVNVTGVLQDLPENSHLEIGALFSSTNFSDELNNTWIYPEFHTYVKLSRDARSEELENHFGAFVDRYLGEVMREFGIEEKLTLQPVRDIHLGGNLLKEAKENGNQRTVSFLVLLALMVLVIAWINFVNLSTSRSTERSTEVGIRKVIGASKGDIIGQFFMESALLNLLAILVAVLLILMVTPFFNQLTGSPVLGERPMAQIWDQTLNWKIVTLLFLGGTFLAGLYPALVLSSFQPVRTIKGRLFRSESKVHFRHIMVIFQFLISILMIAGTIIVYKQMSFLRSHDLGFNIDQLLIVKAPSIIDSTRSEEFRVFQERLMQEPQVLDVTASSDIPGHFFQNVNSIKRKEQSTAESFFVTYQFTDEHYLPTYGLHLVTGRNFSKDRGIDENAVILSAKAVEQLGFGTSEEALGRAITRKMRNWQEVNVVGVVKDINHRSLAYEQMPFAFFYAPTHPFDYYTIKVKTQNVAQTVGRVQKAFQLLFPSSPFEHFFLDDYFDEQYQADQQFGQVFSLFTGLTIFVACLGLLGLISYVTARRTKEIGIRKVLGASVLQILLLLGKQFISLILIAAVLGIPLAWWSGNRWLNNYAHRIDMSAVIFIMPLVLLLLIAMSTVAFQSSKAALTSPVISLREE